VFERYALHTGFALRINYQFTFLCCGVLRAAQMLTNRRLAFVSGKPLRFTFNHFALAPTRLTVQADASVTDKESRVSIRIDMRADIILIRVVFTAILITAGYVLRPFGDSLISAVAAAMIAVAIIFFELRIRQASLKTLIGAAIGSIMGILGAFLIGLLIINQETGAVSPEVKAFLTLSLAFFMGYVGLMVGAAKGDYLDLAALGGIFSERAARRDYKILDTSVIIDGRISDVAETGFLGGTIILPQFVLRELQQVADSPDSSKRQRGRRGLDMLNRLQNNNTLDIQVVDTDFPAVREVDLKLIELAKQLAGMIVTNDFNLNKVAQLHGVQVLNITNSPTP
jgi:uncharacterized protein YacL